MTTFFVREPFYTWRKKNFVRVLVQTGKKRDARLANVPTIIELMQEYKTPETTRKLATLALASDEFCRPIVATPGIAAERARMLRDAYVKTLKDPELLAEAKKRLLEIDPTVGQELEAWAKDVLSANKGLVDRLQQLLNK